MWAVSILSTKCDKGLTIKQLRLQQKLKKKLENYLKLELSIEAVFQVAGRTAYVLISFCYHLSYIIFFNLILQFKKGQLILLLLAETKTPTTAGLKMIFKRANNFYLIISIGWSLKTCISLHMRALSLEKPFFPTTSNIIALILTVDITAKRLLVLLCSFLRNVQFDAPLPVCCLLSDRLGYNKCYYDHIFKKIQKTLRIIPV